MATMHGPAGQDGKSKAIRQARKLFWSYALLAFVALYALGFVFGYFLRITGVYLALIPLAASLGLLTFVWRKLEPYFDSTAKQRLWFMRGAQAEALVSWLLDELEEDWHVFNIVQLEGSSDIDPIVVGPGGLFCISTKSQRGLFDGTPDGLLYNNEPSAFASQALGQTMALRDRIAGLFGGGVPWIQPIPAVPFGFTKRDPCNGKVWLAHQDSIFDRICADPFVKNLKPADIARLVKVLEMLQASAADLYRRPDPPPLP